MTATRWEYRIVEIETSPAEPVADAAEALNLLGDSHWELVSVMLRAETQWALAFLKRPIG